MSSSGPMQIARTPVVLQRHARSPQRILRPAARGLPEPVRSWPFLPNGSLGGRAFCVVRLGGVPMVEQDRASRPRATRAAMRLRPPRSNGDGRRCSRRRWSGRPCPRGDRTAGAAAAGRAVRRQHGEVGIGLNDSRRTAGSLAGERAQRIVIMRVGQKAHVEHQVRLARQAVAVGEGGHGHGQLVAGASREIADQMRRRSPGARCEVSITSRRARAAAPSGRAPRRCRR